mgnify:CR=1 FL=1
MIEFIYGQLVGLVKSLFFGLLKKIESLQLIDREKGVEWVNDGCKFGFLVVFHFLKTKNRFTNKDSNRIQDTCQQLFNYYQWPIEQQQMKNVNQFLITKKNWNPVIFFCLVETEKIMTNGPSCVIDNDDINSQNSQRQQQTKKKKCKTQCFTFTNKKSFRSKCTYMSHHHHH